MPRKKYAAREATQPDVKYNSTDAQRFIHSLMLTGKKSLAERIFYDSLAIIEKKTGQDGLTVLKTALTNVKPAIEVKSRRVGGATYQVPVEVRPERRRALGIRWLITYAKGRAADHTMAEKLASELLAASKGEGGAVKKREDTHKMAEANKAFAHYRW